MEVWLHTFAFPGRVVETARAAEAWGFDGMLVADSQNLTAEIWVELALAAAATETLRLGPGVTNPATRHPAVTASAAATLQVESRGRVVLGIGRGDSALRQIGRHPTHVDELEQALTTIQKYLRGETIEIDGFASTLAWLAKAPPFPKVEVSVGASGPRVIELAARLAERIDFTVGAEPDRLRWAVEAARAQSSDVSLGAFVNVGVDPDPARARDLVRGSAATFARFSAEGAPPDGLSPVTRKAIDEIAAGYDESKHGQASAAHATSVSDEFVDRFAIAGDADHVAERILGLAEIGIERVVVVPCSLDTPPADLERSNEMFAADVLPRLR